MKKSKAAITSYSPKQDLRHEVTESGKLILKG